jgi:hypothetical protein
MSISLSRGVARAFSLLLLSAPLFGLGPVACSSATGDPVAGNSGGSTGKTGGNGGNSATGGSTGTGGASSGGNAGNGTGGSSGTGSGGNSASGGSGTGGGGSSSGGSTGTGGGGTADAGGAGAGGGSGSDAAAAGGKFSFFVTSMEAMIRLSKSDKGFGGDLRYGQADGVSGADKICTEIAEFAVPGSGAKVWHAFLSAAKGPGGTPVNAIDRVGNGPWYDRKGRVFALTKADLVANRPKGIDPAIAQDFPNENGLNNSHPVPGRTAEDDNHHFLTGSNPDGTLMGAATCDSWTTTTTTPASRPRIGFSFTAGGRTNWISGQTEGGCGAGINIKESGGSDPSNPIVGSGGGYGGIYCFAMQP